MFIDYTMLYNICATASIDKLAIVINKMKMRDFEKFNKLVHNDTYKLNPFCAQQLQWQFNLSMGQKMACIVKVLEKLLSTKLIWTNWIEIAINLIKLFTVLLITRYERMQIGEF